MSGEKRAVVSIQSSTSDTDLVGAVATGVGMGVAAVGMVAVGTGVLAVKSTKALADKIQIERHKVVVRECRKKVAALQKGEAVQRYASDKVKSSLAATLDKIKAVDVPNTTSKARKAAGDAAEYLSAAERAAQPALLTYELVTACSDLLQKTAPHTSLLRRAEKLEKQLMALRSSIEDAHPVQTAEEAQFRQQIKVFAKECKETMQCAKVFSKIARYIKEIEHNSWAENLDFSNALNIAANEDLTVQAIDEEYSQLLQSAIEEYVKILKDKDFKERRLYKQIKELEIRTAELEEEYQELKQTYYNEAQSVFSSASSIRSQLRGALHERKIDNTCELLSELDEELSQLPEQVDRIKRKEAERDSLLKEFTDNVQAFLVKLEHNEEQLPSKVQKMFQGQGEKLQLRADRLLQDTLERARTGTEKLGQELSDIEQQLPVTGCDYDLRNLLKEYAAEGNVTWEQDDSDLMESDDFCLSAEVDDEEVLALDYSVDVQQGRIVLEYRNDEKEVTCAAFKRLLRYLRLWIARVNSESIGIQIRLDVLDELGNPVDISEEQGVKEKEDEGQGTGNILHRKMQQR